MEKVAKTAGADEPTVEERNLLSVAYKNVIGARRASQLEAQNTVCGLSAVSRGS